MTAWDRFTAWLSIEATFLIAVVGGAVIKIALSPDLTFWQRAFTGFVAVWSAWVFTDPVLRWFVLDPSYKAPVAAVVALTGEGLARMVVNLVSDREVLLDILRAWRGK